MKRAIKRFVNRAMRSYVLFVVLGVVVGLTLAPVAWSTTSGPEGTVAVIPLEGTINGQSAAAVTAQLERAREDPSIDAVVIVSNSGGGGASASEELYLETKRTAAEMPVVAAVDAGAASGAYYTVAASDYIYAKPSSIVGSIGVLATLPSDAEPNGIIATTGPNKLTGADRREYLYLLESLQASFISAVTAQRGENLTLSSTQLEEARIYSGAQATQVGLVDEIGGRGKAVRHAAQLAGLDDYRVKVLRPDVTPSFLSRNNYLASSAPEKRSVSARYLVDTDSEAPTFLMVPPSYVAEALKNETKPARNRSDGYSEPDSTAHSETNSTASNGGEKHASG